MISAFHYRRETTSFEVTGAKSANFKDWSTCYIAENLSASLCNGTKGVVVSLGENPVINFNGNLHTIERANVDVLTRENEGIPLPISVKASVCPYSP